MLLWLLATLFYPLDSLRVPIRRTRDFIGSNSTTTDSKRSTLGSCEWFGLAPFCLQSCPTGWDYIREHSGRCDDGRPCIPDPSFGEVCFNVFGHQLKKKFCCKSDPVDCSWTGRWMGSHDAFNFYCRFDASIGRCGRISCSVNSHAFQSRNSSLIGGENCEEIFLWGLHGFASCGYIAWFKESGDYTKLVNSWYKSH